METDTENALLSKISCHLKQICYLAEKLDCKHKAIQNKIENNVLDKNVIKCIGVELVTFLKKFEGNIIYVINSLEESLRSNSTNNNCALQTEKNDIGDCIKTGIINTNDIFDKEISTIFGKTCNVNILDRNPDAFQTKLFETNDLNDSGLKERLNFALKNMTTSQDTDDEGWVDSLQKTFNRIADLPKPMKENIKCEEDTNVDNAFSRNTACLGDYDLQEACFTGSEHISSAALANYEDKSVTFGEGNIHNGNKNHNQLVNNMLNQHLKDPTNPDSLLPEQSLDSKLCNKSNEILKVTEECQSMLTVKEISPFSQNLKAEIESDCLISIVENPLTINDQQPGNSSDTSLTEDQKEFANISINDDLYNSIMFEKPDDYESPFSVATHKVSSDEDDDPYDGNSKNDMQNFSSSSICAETNENDNQIHADLRMSEQEAQYENEPSKTNYGNCINEEVNISENDNYQSSLEISIQYEATNEIDSDQTDIEKSNTSKSVMENDDTSLKSGNQVNGESNHSGGIQESTITTYVDSGESADSFSFDLNQTDELLNVPNNVQFADKHSALDDTEFRENPLELKYEIEYNVGDNLLELLKEVKLPVTDNITSHHVGKHNLVSDTIKSKELATTIFEDLQKECLDTTDSDGSQTMESLDSLSLLGLDHDTEDSEESVDSEDAKEHSENKSLSFDIDKDKIPEQYSCNCYVLLERLNFQKYSLSGYENSFNIDTLCNLNALYSKRKYQEVSSSSKKRHSKKICKGKDNFSGSSAEDLSDVGSIVEIVEKDMTILEPDLEKKIEGILAEHISKDLNHSDKNSEENEDGDNELEHVKKKKRSASHTGQGHVSHSLWRNDPLLKERLQFSDSSDGVSECSSSRKKKKPHTRYEYDTDFVTTTDKEQSDSDSEDIEDRKSKLDAHLISPINRNIPPSDSSDSDSEIEFMSPNLPFPQQGVKEEYDGSPRKGRRNIRSLMSDELLAEGTQKARELELERINRVKSKKKNSSSLSQSLSNQLEDEEPYVLEADEKTCKSLIEVHPKFVKRMKPHQLKGVEFMWNCCYESISRLNEDPGSGCILAHCMGLGKTFQVLVLIHTLFSYETTKTQRILIICPLSTVNNWKKEEKLAYRNIPNKKIKFFFICGIRDFNNKLEAVRAWYLRKCPSVLVMGYEAYETLTNELKLQKTSSKTKKIVLRALVDPGPDLIVCDEGHLLKNNNSRKSLALNKIRTKRRIILTGTPMQNNLLEYYCMVQFVKPNLLGNPKEFKTNFVNPIANGQYQDSTSEDIRIMHKRTHVLHKLLKGTIQRVEDTELKQYLPKMLDHAVFIQLHPVQVDLYKAFSNKVQNRNSKKKFLSDFAIFQYICTHPHLMSIMERQTHKKIIEQDVITNDKDSNFEPISLEQWKEYLPADSPNRIEYGTKLVVLNAIIEECETIGDKLLVFSQTLGELDLIEHFLQTVGTSHCSSWKKKEDYYRLDGTVNPEKRTAICDSFNDRKNSKMRLLLMSIKVGGLGLNLTAANRVVIMTVHWNPSYDTQSVFRVYRFGQQKNVYVYRLIALGTMEEKVYQRTINKLATAHRVVDKHQISRHFKSIDLQELYLCQPNADEERPTSNIPEDQMLAKVILNLPCIFKYHEHNVLLENKPEDNLTESELALAWEEFRTVEARKIANPQTQVPESILPKQLFLADNADYTAAIKLLKGRQLDEYINNITHHLTKPSVRTKQTPFSSSLQQPLSLINGLKNHPNIISVNKVIHEMRTNVNGGVKENENQWIEAKKT